MSTTARIYECGCYDGEFFELCRKARRLEDRMHDADLEVQSCCSSAPTLAEYPLTYDDPKYFERGHSAKEHAEKLAGVAAQLEDLYYREVAARRRAHRAHRAISFHLRVQDERGTYRDIVIEAPPEPDFDAADL